MTGEGIALVGLGGALGAMARYLVHVWVSERLTGSFPWATFLINVTGSLAIGFLLTLAVERSGLDPRWRLLVVTGFLGGYTTFSTFSAEALALLEARAYAPALLYFCGSPLVAVTAAVIGALIARRL